MKFEFFCPMFPQIYIFSMYLFDTYLSFPNCHFSLFSVHLVVQTTDQRKGCVRSGFTGMPYISVGVVLSLVVFLQLSSFSCSLSSFN